MQVHSLTPLLALFAFLPVFSLANLHVTPSGQIVPQQHTGTTPLTVAEINTRQHLERSALVQLYTESRGEHWRDNNHWLQGDPCGTDPHWYGVACNEYHFVTRIELAANQLNGTLPPDLFRPFTQLEQLDLSLNYLKGAVPSSLSTLLLLKTLDLGYNYFLMPLNVLSPLVRLEKLCLRWNTLITGSLHALAPLKALQTLNLRDNHMEALTLDGIEELTALKHVELTKSGLKGDLHPWHLNRLVSFKAGHNRLSGTSFSTLGQRSSSSSSSSSSPAVDLSSLLELDLSFNMLSGPLPRLVPFNHTAKGAHRLQQLDLSNNRFLASRLRLSDHVHLTTLKLNSNRLEQPFFYNLHVLPRLKVFECAHCHLSGVLSLPRSSTFPQLHTFSVPNNQLVGLLPQALYRMHALETLDLSNNHLVGPLSPRIGQLGYLTTLRLHFNALTGAIPLELSECIDLKTLRLEHNRFQGPLLNLFQHGLDRLSLFSLHHNNITSLPKTLPSHVQVWPYHLRPLAKKSTSGSTVTTTTLVVYHNNLKEPVEEGGAEEGGVQGSVHGGVEDVRMFKVSGTMNDFYANALFKAGWLRTDTERWHACYGLCWENERDKDPNNVLSIQRVSRYPEVSQVSDKGLLTFNIDAMRALYPKEYSFYPTSFTIPNQLEEYIATFNKVQSTQSTQSTITGHKAASSMASMDYSNNLWLMKPRARCCGEGIRIINNATQSADIVNPDLGEWYVQRFVSPPALIDGHKFVFRLFALVTSFSPLRVQLYHDGLIFYTFTEYTVANQTAKRSYISDYFFTEKQSDYYVLVQDYLTNLAQQTHYKTTTNHGGSGGGSSSKSQVGGEPQAKQLWDDIKSVVVKSLVATLKWTGPMEATKSSPGTTYEIFGYDIVLDDDLNPFLCEINETPNMGLEVNYHGDYNGLGEAIEQIDYDYKTRLMEATLSVADVEPRWGVDELKHIESELIQLIDEEGLGCVVVNNAMVVGKGVAVEVGGAENGVDNVAAVAADCLHDEDLQILVKLESELRRSDGNDYDQIFPCIDCATYFKLFSVNGLEWNDVLDVWWLRQRETHRYHNGLTHRYEPEYLATHGEPIYETWLSFLLKHIDAEEEEEATTLQEQKNTSE